MGFWTFWIYWEKVLKGSPLMTSPFWIKLGPHTEQQIASTLMTTFLLAIREHFRTRGSMEVRMEDIWCQWNRQFPATVESGLPFFYFLYCVNALLIIRSLLAESLRSQRISTVKGNSSSVIEMKLTYLRPRKHNPSAASLLEGANR